MLSPSLSLLALGLASVAPALAAKPGGFEDGGDTLVSAMMMFVGNEEKVYILDKAEGNAAQVNNHPAWASVWDINTRLAEVMDVPSNVFCSSGMHLPNGSFATFGGNGAVGRGGQIGSVKNPGGFTASWDAEYQNSDGSRAIRILDPCTSADDFNSRQCRWFDDATVLAMKVPRWYSTAEPLADGTIVMIGGFTTGGYINRNYPNTEPNGGGSQNSYEFFPARDGDPPNLPFLTHTSGLNTYVHAFMMPSGLMFLQANVSTTLWNYNDNTETRLPDMPNGVVRVYPASGAVAMLPLTPANNYNPTIIFCGGTDMKDEEWGDFAYPYINTWDYPASKDCQRITPEPEDGSAPVYEQDDDMLEGRTMGQFIILPDGKLLVLNGALNGTAGYAQSTLLVESYADMPWGESLAAGPVLTPAIYDPNAPRGQRWTRAGLEEAKYPRMYHSSAMLLPDGSVLVAGSNPNVDVNLTTIFPTTYAAEIFYPPYFSAPVRPVPSGIPKTLSYGGEPFDITIPATSYSGSANDAADATVVSVLRGGFTTHAMNMGQRYLQLENTYTVQSDGSIVLHVAQMPPNPNIFQPGPAFVYVTIKGIPSNGTYVIVGSGQMGPQPTQAASTLPPSVRLDTAKGAADGSQSGKNTESTDGKVEESGGLGTGAIIGLAAGGVAAIAILGALLGVFLARRRRAAGRDAATNYPMAGAGMASVGGAGAFAAGARGVRDSDSSAFVPLAHGNHSHTWNQSTASLVSPYKDHDMPSRASGTGISMEYDPYGNPSHSGVQHPYSGQPHRY
ncbi:copper radical oxidase variant A [Coprinopsis cinerea okayama7|uniref:Copper radical oxidase variant A n=1 Tax=Coprinopsis cinerea (strain Okayama-7 / 130 / ATCC MYA-4618 / FGSC 9003) TaxID=240176 RepID=A8NND5_COPC7|nr:copper radical oxidase variant A [Coprinopsis cinerea okayama7\|eukprot:XP_001835107.1 copper radical oxidase variant A [Coprinopsis cinerea okayama7\